MNERTRKIVQQRLLRLLIVVCIVGFIISLFVGNAMKINELEVQVRSSPPNVEPHLAAQFNLSVMRERL